MAANLNEEDSIRTDLLARFGEDLWLSRRLECEPVVNFITEIKTKDEEEGQILVNFIKFLEAECSGVNFVSDKQWSELLNLMQISRKLNHRTVKLKDILRNQHIIENNERLIRQFNLTANANKTIENSLEQLEALLQTGYLEICDDNLLMPQLTQAKVYLESRCWPLLSIIKLELNDDLVTNSSSTSKQVVVWRQKLEKQEQVVVSLIKFFGLMIKLESKLVRLKPMLNETEKSPSGSQKSELAEKIETCRRLFFKSHQFHSNLADEIRNLSRVHRKILLSKLATNPVTKDGEKLEKVIQNLDDCQSILQEVMSTLRLEFGRFYFVSDLELLTIITLDWRLLVDNSVRNSQIISKLFNNSIDSFVVDYKKQILTHVNTPYGEVVALRGEPVAMRKKVNVYSLEIVRIFNEMIRRLRQTLRLLLFEQIARDEDQNLIDKSLPLQVMNLVEWARFCSRAEKSIEEDTIDGLIQFYNSRFASLKREEPNNQSWLDKFKSSALISMTVHFLTQLVKLKEVKSVEDWRWTKQVRYYHLPARERETEDELEVRIGEAKFLYKFNFLALQANNQQHRQASFKRLITTESSERCFLVASTAVCNFRLGACPYGPAGSGKTETIKALGHLLGCQVIVHNCDETNQSESLDRLIWGLAHAGLWGCFDEFNRLSSSALSSVSSTLELVQASIREDRLNAELPDGSLMCIDQTSAFFVTLNPQTSDNKYRGRRQLPANMRNLFMPIAMIRVEIENIVSELLLAMEFSSKSIWSKEAMELGKTLAGWFDWIRSNLNSCQGRVEWDLRLVMAILKRLKFAPCDTNPKEMLAQSVVCEVACRLNSQELEQFKESLGEHFSIKQEPSRAIDPVRALEEQLETRAGVILLGSSRSGKSLTWRQLAAKMVSRVKWFAVNPRACERNKLFGYVEFSTKKWIDGLLTVRVREALEILQTNDDIEQFWIILDGPIDPDWIESLNSVLDDNQVLTLGSGERLDFLVAADDNEHQKSIKLIFETNDISNASPATISRLGIVYHEGEIHQEMKQIENLDEFIESESDRLCALIGCNRVENLENYAGIEYNCSESSTSSHLIELIEKFPQTKLIILNNIDLVKSQDAWGAIDLWELLRFIITYKGYYSDENRFIPSDLKFIVSTKSLELLDERLKSRISSFMHSKDNHNDLMLADLSECFLSPKPIICLKSETREPEQREKITSSLSSQDWDLLNFSSSLMVEQSLDVLKEALEDNSVKGRKKLFFLYYYECCLMDKKSRCDLFHCLNFLQIKKPKTIKFVYLVSKNEGNETYWRSISGGDFYILKSFSPSPSEDLESYFNQEINIRWRKQSKWLAQKVLKYLHNHQVDLTDFQGLQLLKDTMLELIERSTLALEAQQKTLSLGLDRLNEFEKSVEQIRKRCKLQENELLMKKEHISKMISSIAVTLNESHKQRGQITKLKEEQQLKTKEIERKSKRVEEELSQVSELVESSKSDVAKHLKPEALNEIKGLRSPPKTIEDILDVLFVFLNLGDSSNSWTAMKSQLAKISLKDELNNYDFKKNLNENLLNQVRVMMGNAERASSFTDLQASRASKAVVPILGWIRAALEFGEVLVKLNPLHKEMDLLKSEAKKLDTEAKELEDQLLKVEVVMEKDSQELAQLKREFEESQNNLETIKGQLQEALRTRSDLTNQVERWRAKLEKISSNLSPESNLVKACLAAATLSCFKHQLTDLDSLLNLFELESLTDRDFVHLAIDLLLNDDEEVVSAKVVESDDVGTMFQLMVMRICLMPMRNSLVPFLYLENNTRRLDESQLVQYLSSSEILIKDQKAIAIVRPPREGSVQRMNEWCQLIELQFRLNKLVVLDLQDDHSHLPSLNFDISNLILRSGLTTKKGENLVSIEGEKRMVIVGQLNSHQGLIPLVRPLNLILKASFSMANRDECLSTILNKLIQHRDQKLGETWEKLNREFQAKQKQSKSMEINLLKRLSAISSAVSSPLETNRSLDDLVKVLSNLHQVNLQLKKDMVELNCKLGDLQRKQGEYLNLAKEAAQFYLDYLVDLDEFDSFYHVSLEAYINWLLDAETINYRLVIERVMRPMRPVDRLKFQEKLLKSNKKCDLRTGVDSLGLVIEDLLDEMEQSKTWEPKLMLVLHEATKSSPLLEMEEILKSSHGKRLCYSKTYGTAGSGKGLETSLDKILTNSTDSAKINCLCIVNAHLSSRWINARLTEMLKLNQTQTKALVILVGESAGSSQETSKFDQELINYAHAKYWHDELALNLSTRFNLLRNALSASNNGITLMVKKLILFHVVCQELTKAKECNIEGGHCWLKSYSFDYDQLLLARKSLLSLQVRCRDAGGEQLASLVCRYLDNIIYGPRMETTEDGRLLSRLARRFILDSDAINSFLAQVENGNELATTIDCVLMLINEGGDSAWQR